jgi:hypothetical protein
VVVVECGRASHGRSLSIVLVSVWDLTRTVIVSSGGRGLYRDGGYKGVDDLDF